MARVCSKCGVSNGDAHIFCDECGNPLTSIDTRKLQLLDNRYVIIQVIKFGAMGTVFKAYDARLENVVAVKKMIIPEEFRKNRDYFEERFRTEARILSQLDFPGLPKVMDYFIERDLAGERAQYLVMTYIKGKDLETCLRENFFLPLSLERALDWFRQILNILSYLHGQEPPIVYRDIKPSNIMIDGEELFLIDFGIARIFDTDRKGTVICTPGYAAPEMLKGYSDPKSDLFSLGVLMHYLLTGHDPLDKNRSLFTFESPRSCNREVPPYLDRLIMKLLDINSAKRPGSANEVLEALDAGMSKSRKKKPEKAQKESKKPSQKQATLSLKQKSAKAKKEEKESILSPPEFSLEKSRILPDQDELFHALRENFPENARIFLEDPEYVNARDPHQRTPLHFAAFKGYEDLAGSLLWRGAEVNVQDDNGWTPLHFAAYYGYLDIVNNLLIHGAQVNFRDNNGWTPLDKARYQGHSGIISLLVAGGAKEAEKTAASLVEELEAIRMQLKKDFTAGASKGSGAFTDYTSFYTAIRKNDVVAVRSFIENGADVNRKNRAGNPPLCIAAAAGKLDAVKLLLEKKADIMQRTDNGQTALHVAVKRKHKTIADVLIDTKTGYQARTLLNAKDSDGKTPLHVVVWDNQYDMTEFLLEKGAYVNAKEKDGWTPLRWAKLNNRKIAALLRKHGGKD